MHSAKGGAAILKVGWQNFFDCHILSLSVGYMKMNLITVNVLAVLRADAAIFPSSLDKNTNINVSQYRYDSTNLLVHPAFERWGYAPLRSYGCAALHSDVGGYPVVYFPTVITPSNRRNFHIIVVNFMHTCRSPKHYGNSGIQIQIRITQSVTGCFLSLCNNVVKIHSFNFCLIPMKDAKNAIKQTGTKNNLHGGG